MLLGGLLRLEGASRRHEEETEGPIAAEMGRIRIVLPTSAYIPLSR